MTTMRPIGSAEDRRVQIRVSARGAAYVQGLVAGRLYEALVRARWPDTVWPQRTGLSRTCFLLPGMYELVADPAEPTSRGQARTIDEGARLASHPHSSPCQSSGAAVAGRPAQGGVRQPPRQRHLGRDLCGLWPGPGARVPSLASAGRS